MIKLTRMLLLAGALSLTACGGGQDEGAKGTGDHVFATQQKALESARETGALLEDVAQRKKKQTDAAQH